MRVYILLLIFLSFSFWLMFHTFRSNSDTLYVSAKVYSDFGSLLPLIRYFPQGFNFPIEHPLFPGEPIRYHFLFYAPVSFLESLGVPLQLALNLPSALGFFSLLFLIFYLGKKAGLLAVILFLFNSSFSFLDYINKPSYVDFVSFRPWNNSLISAFWNLNIYTNQRHLAFSFAVCLLIILITYKLKNNYLYLVGFLFGSLLLLNQAGFLISAVFLFFAYLLIPSIRIRLLISFIGFLPWYLLYRQIFTLPDLPQKYFGFLSDQPANFLNLFNFWFYNYGLSLFLIIPTYVIFKNKIYLPILVLFILGNTLRLSPDIVNNHKLFNFIFLINNIFIAKMILKYKILFILFPLLIAGGIVDIFPVINDRLIPIPVSADQKYFSILPKKSVILNSTWFYHPASWVGLPIYNGYSYFTWSYGYDQTSREELTKQIYNSSDPCLLLAKTPITHIEISPHHEQFLTINPIYDTFQSDYTNPISGLKVYSVSNICPNI